MQNSTRTIQVNTTPAYDVTIGGGLLHNCGQHLLEVLAPCHVAVMTDSTVASLYLDAVCSSLQSTGFTVSSYVFPAGEANKNLETLTEILEFLAEQRLTRTDCIVALGGGVTGDMAGFAAAVYLRGIRCVQIPTTLLSAVDSSVGGKTAIDLKAGKIWPVLSCSPPPFCATRTAWLPFPLRYLRTVPPRPSKPAFSVTNPCSLSSKPAIWKLNRLRSSHAALPIRPALWSGTKRNSTSGNC